jgi:DNA modification methylase
MELINGDCLKELTKIKDNSIDLIVTSPPYFNVKEYSHWETYDDYMDWLKQVFLQCYSVLKEGRMCCVNISTIIIPRKNRQDESKRIALPFHFVNIMEDIGFKFLEDIIWLKPNPSVPNRNGGFYRHRKPVAYKPNCVNEYVFVFQKPIDCLIDDIIKGYDKNTVENSLIKEEYYKTNVWEISPVKNKFHPAVYPYKLAYHLVKYYSFQLDIVLDPFMGSGTTGKVCKDIGREFIGIELNKDYFDLALSQIDLEQRRLV